MLIQGDTGTGKELVAKAIHQNSPRKKRPFVPLNCAALSEHILESELFGHIRGAFTDASTDRQGKFEYANGGTLFLDEVGDMPIPTQIKLLRVLESGEITRVGSNEPVKVNVRILSATNRDLEKAIAAGTFREDLYHRLKVVTINLPRLAERREDIPLLIDYFIKEHTQAAPEDDPRHLDGRPAAAVGVRLAGQRAAAAERDREHGRRRLSTKCSTSTTCRPNSRPPTARPPSAAGRDGLHELVGKPLAEIEALFIAETLKVTGGNREEAAEHAGHRRADAVSEDQGVRTCN